MRRHIILCRYWWFENSPHIIFFVFVFCLFVCFILNYYYLCTPWWHTGFNNPILLKFTNFHSHKIWIQLLDLVAISLYLVEIPGNKVGSAILTASKAKQAPVLFTTNSGNWLPYSNVTLRCRDWNSRPRITSQKNGSI